MGKGVRRVIGQRLHPLTQYSDLTRRGDRARGCSGDAVARGKNWGAQNFTEDCRCSRPPRAACQGSSPSLSAVAIVVGTFHVLIRYNAWRVARPSH